MGAMPGFPHAGFPEGWFGLGWSDQFPEGQIVSRRYFGQEMAVFRTQSGRLSAVNGFCRHMGAKFAVGGRVEGECIVCPFHGWQWAADGRVAKIPYAEGAITEARLKTWPVVESGGLAWIWNSWRSPQEPNTPAPDLGFLAEEGYFFDPEASRREWLNVRLAPQMVAENIVDGPHIEFVHQAQTGGHIAGLEERGSVFWVELAQTFPTRSGPILGKTDIQAFGVGAQLAQMNYREFTIVNVLTTTPVELDRCDMRVSIFLGLPEELKDAKQAADLPERYQRAIKSHIESQEQDLPLWEAMHYEARPLLVGEEVEGHARFRKWAKQFYQA